MLAGRGLVTSYSGAYVTHKHTHTHMYQMYTAVHCLPILILPTHDSWHGRALKADMRHYHVERSSANAHGSVA